MGYLNGGNMEKGKDVAKNGQFASLSFSQMDSLSAICDTFLPSIDANSLNQENMDDSIIKFLNTSASMNGTPQHLAWMVSERIQHPKLNLCKLALWLLSTRIGTFVLCGMASLSSQFPYLQNFSKVSPNKREEIVQSWSCSNFKLIKLLFVAMKVLTLLVFFTQVDEKSQNPSWKGLGYWGQDPEFKKQKQEKINSKQNKHEEFSEKEQEQLYGPLYKGIITLKQPQHALFNKLQKLGFHVSKPNSSSNCPSFIIECDAVVVGSGSGGGVIAGVLANAGHKVLVLEKGSYLARTNLSLLEGPSMDQMFLGNGLMMTKDMDVFLLAGSTVGGGSTINWSASIDTPSHVLKEWCDIYELEMFQSEFYKEALEIICEKMGVQDKIDEEGFQNMILRKGCEELGYPVENIPRNTPSNHYCGWCSMGCKDGRKKGTNETWLVDLVKSGNGAIIQECEALEVIHEQKNNYNKSKAIGVACEFQHEGVKEIFMVKSKVTIVACGALRTPSLLKKSGLKNPNIGKNLHVHPVVFAWGHFPDKDNTDNVKNFEVWPKSEKKSYEGGIMSAMSKVVANFEESGYGVVIQTPALHPGMFSVVMPWISGLDIKMRMCKYSRTAHIFALARDKGSGEAISPHSITYKLDQIDEENLKIGLEKILRILAAAGAEEIGTHHGTGKKLKVKESSVDEFESFVKEESSREFKNLSIPICSAHQMGSCRMGVDPNISVVNPKGETWEVEDLFIGDTSVFPTALGVNPMVTVQAISYCTAQNVLQVLKAKKKN
ncbi:long-chain-alcohol oxidase FAO4A-like [Solanum dulcamara]|uniref:long-chain-alcohol oxidase FAO4A-like n=1 Tax=Solanum dulcamara TaxID=45834 RepID=UPI0024868404|nr:long-chain-alcohol oxidase FAO4A-like [Solanum dulcamara]